MKSLWEAMDTIVINMAESQFYASIYLGSLQMDLDSHGTMETFRKSMKSALPVFYAAVLVFSTKAKGYFQPLGLGNCLSLPTVIGFVYCVSYLTFYLAKLTNYLEPFSITLGPYLQEIDASRQKLKRFASIATMERIKGWNEPRRLSAGGLIYRIESSESVRETVKYLAELKTNLANIENMGTDIQASSVVPQLRARTDSLQLTKKYAEATQERQLLAKLPVAEGAPFDSKLQRHEPQCLATTREQLLDEIDKWCRTFGDACIYWLSGMAGTGKSTIARTIAHRLAKERILGASFFFSRGQGDVGNAAKFFTTIAALLVENIPSLKPHVCRAIAEDSRILAKGPRYQWEQLILQPLKKLPTDSLDTRFVLVIDALDECDDDRDAGLILQLLSEIGTISSIQLRAFITSRPERHIGFGFRSLPQSTHHCFILHEIPARVVDNDIQIFLLHETKKIRQEYFMPHEWPGDGMIQLLCERAGQLFIYASTACLLMRSSLLVGPERELATVFDDFKELDELYVGVLENAMRHYGRQEASYKVKLKSQFQRILGCIVILLNAVSVAPLARLCGLDPMPVFHTVNTLGAILVAPKTPSDVNRIRLHHPSFRDFLLDPERCLDSRFRIDEAEAHRNLFSNCLELMSKLQKDICNLQHPGILASAVEKDEVEKFLTPEIQYACRYWTHHLQRSNTVLCNDDKVHSFLLKHFLHWLEALALIGVFTEGVHAAITLETMLTV